MWILDEKLTKSTNPGMDSDEILSKILTEYWAKGLSEKQIFILNLLKNITYTAPTRKTVPFI